MPSGVGVGDFFLEEYLNVVTCYEYIISHMFWVTFDATRLPGKRNAAMGKRNATRVTAADIAKSGDLGSLIKKLVKQAAEGDNEAKESAAATLSSLAFRASHQHSNSGPARVAYAPLLTRPDWCLSPLVSSRRKS